MSDMLDILFILAAILLVLADVIVVITSDKLYAGNFIRKLRYFVYSITPARYIFVMIVSGIIGKTADFNFHAISIMEILLLSGFLLTYAEKLITLRQKKKERTPAKRLKPLKQKKG